MWRDSDGRLNTSSFLHMPRKINNSDRRRLSSDELEAVELEVLSYESSTKG